MVAFSFISFGILLLSRRWLLLVHGKLSQILHGDAFEGTLVCRLEHNLRHLLVIVAGAVVKRLFPPRHTQTPLAAVCESHLAQVVALRGAVVEKLVCHDACMGELYVSKPSVSK